MVAIAAVGCARLALADAARARRCSLVAFGPYAIFHLLFHETVTVRYALPLVVPIAYLVASALDGPAGACSRPARAALVAWSAVRDAARGARPTARSGSPAFRALVEAAAGGVGDPARPERRRRPSRRGAARGGMDGSRRCRGASLTAPHGREWLALVDHWRIESAIGVVVRRRSAADRSRALRSGRPIGAARVSLGVRRAAVRRRRAAGQCRPSTRCVRRAGCSIAAGR